MTNNKVFQLGNTLAVDQAPSSLRLLREAYKNAKIVNSGKHLTTINELCDQTPALRPELLLEVVDEILKFGTFGATKILTEEDKGAPIATAVSLATKLPLAMARWYPYHLPNQTQVNINSEYFSGSLYLNGLEPNDRVLILEDTLSTGGTMTALIEAIEKADAQVAGAIAVIEKIENDGHDNVWLKTGIDVKTCLQIRVTEKGVEIL